GFTSSLIRAKETLRICLESMGLQETAVHINDAIIEKHFGKDEGETAEVYSETTKKETAETAKLSWDEKFVYKVYPQDPKFESLSQVSQRVLKFLVEERAPGNYLVSTHKVVKKAQLMGLLKQSGIEVGYRSFDLKNCSVFVIEVGKDKTPRLVAATGLEIK
ncbi:MAG TPA: histidine phosphatase family protein, partial [Rhabdochlamydiaceae bacterium]